MFGWCSDDVLVKQHGVFSEEFNGFASVWIKAKEEHDAAKWA